MEAIIRDFGTFDNMKNQLSASTTAVQGSGWGWLGYNTASNTLQLATCFNQDLLQATTGMFDLITHTVHGLVNGYSVLDAH